MRSASASMLGGICGAMGKNPASESTSGGSRLRRLTNWLSLSSSWLLFSFCQDVTLGNYNSRARVRMSRSITHMEIILGNWEFELSMRGTGMTQCSGMRSPMNWLLDRSTLCGHCHLYSEIRTNPQRLGLGRRLAMSPHLSRLDLLVVWVL